MNKQSKLPEIVKPKYDEYIPTMEMRLFTQCLLSEEVKGNKTEAERRTGIRKAIFYYHFDRNIKFRQWFSEQCDKFLGSYEALVASSLKNKILLGDVNAIRTYYELCKKLRHQLEHSGEVKTGETKIIIIRDKDANTIPIDQEANRSIRIKNE